MFGKNWTVTYYNSIDLSGSAVYTEALPDGININWGFGAPHESVNIDNFSARFTSTQTFEAGVYEFVVSSDSGIRVFIDDVLLLDRFVVRPLMTDRFRQRLTAGYHSMKIEYFAGLGQAAIQVQWFQVNMIADIVRLIELLTLEEQLALIKELQAKFTR